MSIPGTRDFHHGLLGDAGSHGHARAELTASEAWTMAVLR